MKGPVRIGLMGCGSVSRVHFGSFDRLGPEKVRVVALLERDGERRRLAAERYPKARATDDPNEMVAPGDLDLVYVCTMPETHKELSILVLEAGTHLMCEKPFAMNYDEAKQIVDTAERLGLMVQVGTYMRYLPNVQYIRQVAASGALGRPVLLRPWTTHINPPSWGPHYAKAVSSGGALASTLVHTIDSSLYVAGHPEPISVSAQIAKLFPGKRGAIFPEGAREAYDVEDLVAAHVRFEGDIMMLAYSNWCLDAEVDTHAFEIVFEKGTVRQKPFEIWEDVEGVPVNKTPPGREAMDSLENNKVPQNTDIIERLLAGKPLGMAHRESLIVQRIADAIYESARVGKEVRLK